MDSLGSAVGLNVGRRLRTLGGSPAPLMGAMAGRWGFSLRQEVLQRSSLRARKGGGERGRDGLCLPAREQIECRHGVLFHHPTHNWSVSPPQKPASKNVLALKTPVKSDLSSSGKNTELRLGVRCVKTWPKSINLLCKLGYVPSPL